MMNNSSTSGGLTELVHIFEEKVTKQHTLTEA